ncbi:hypothetical protein F2Q68_00043659 [Brassica cretica]|uniref:F-box domain-containing protein n=1 Tax=Brassica cretica TaxID=69181 RepID=A0A8S9LR25_BRACR|nr:hypothetical protein F2Q68_00043659 [Brassica cretica]
MRTEEKEQWRSESVHKMLMVLLPYLHSLFELLSLSRVSPALRNAIRDQTVLWTKVVVDPPLSSRLTDDILWDFTSRSVGKLNTLILRKCSRVTSKGLRRVVDANPLIKKLIVTGCTELVPEGITACVETLTKNNHKNVREGTSGSAGDAGIASLDAWSVQCVSAQTLRLKKQRVGETFCVLLVAKRFQSAGSATNPTAQVTPACDKVTQRRTRLCLHAKLVTTGQEQAQAILSF